MTSLNLCPECEKKGIKSVMKPIVCGWFHTALLCEQPSCTYPLEETDTWLVESHKSSQSSLLSFQPQEPQCKYSVQPSLSNIDCNIKHIHLNNESRIEDNDLDFLNDLFADETDTRVPISDITFVTNDELKSSPFTSIAPLQLGSTPAVSYPSFSSSQKSDSPRNSLDDIIPSLANLPVHSHVPSSIPEEVYQVTHTPNEHYCWMSFYQGPVWLRFLQHVAVHLRCLKTPYRSILGRLQNAYDFCLTHLDAIVAKLNRRKKSPLLDAHLVPRLNDFSNMLLQQSVMKDAFPLLAGLLHLIENGDIPKSRFEVTYSQELRCQGCQLGCQLQRSSLVLNFGHEIAPNFRLNDGAETLSKCDKCDGTKTIRTSINKLSSCLLIQFQRRLHKKFRLDRDLCLKEGLSPSLIVESKGISMRKLWIRHPDKKDHWLAIVPTNDYLVNFEERSLSEISSPLVSLVLLEQNPPISYFSHEQHHTSPLNRPVVPKVVKGVRPSAALSVDIDFPAPPPTHKCRRSVAASLPVWSGERASSIKGVTPANQTYLLTRYLANEVKQGETSGDSRSSLPRGNSYLEDLQRECESQFTQTQTGKSSVSSYQPGIKRTRSVKDLILLKARAFT